MVNRIKDPGINSRYFFNGFKVRELEGEELLKEFFNQNKKRLRGDD